MLRWRAIGNDLADRAAKQAVTRHDQPDSTQEAQLRYWARRIPHIVRAVAIALAMFPPAGGKLKRRPRTRQEKPKDETGQAQHEWQHVEGRWRCTRCWTYAQGDRAAPPRATARGCDGTRVTKEMRACTERGHSMLFADAALPFAFCTRCGGWSARRSYRLGKKCGPPTANGKLALARIARGEHPWCERDGRTGATKPRGRVKVRLPKQATPMRPGAEGDVDRGCPAASGRKRGLATDGIQRVVTDDIKRRRGGGGEYAEPVRALEDGTAADEATAAQGSPSPAVPHPVHAGMDVDNATRDLEADLRRERDATLLRGTSMGMIISFLRGLPDRTEGTDLVKIFNGYAGRFVEVTIKAVERERDRLRAEGRRDDDSTCLPPGRAPDEDRQQCSAPEEDGGSFLSYCQSHPQARPAEESGHAIFASRAEMLVHLRRGNAVACDGAGEQPGVKKRRLADRGNEKDSHEAPGTDAVHLLGRGTIPCSSSASTVAGAIGPRSRRELLSSLMAPAAQGASSCGTAGQPAARIEDGLCLLADHPRRLRLDRLRHDGGCHRRDASRELRGSDCVDARNPRGPEGGADERASIAPRAHPCGPRSCVGTGNGDRAGEGMSSGSISDTVEGSSRADVANQEWGALRGGVFNRRAATSSSRSATRAAGTSRW